MAADTGAQTITAKAAAKAQHTGTPTLTRHEPLYLKHRPQSLDQLVGQSAVTQTLTNAINHDRLSHAYLFTGPRGTGKTSSARILAKSLNCKGTDDSGNPIDRATTTPCQQCASCIEIKNGNSPAVMEIDAASNNSVDDARILIERAPLVAPGGRYKIYIIDECHMLTKEAFNALLKTIEDPPPNVVFILATTEEHKVLPTIISRCQRLMFRLVTQDDLLGHLRNVADEENIAITDRALEFIARRSGGGLRDALSLLDQSSLLSAPGKPVEVGDLLNLLGALHEDVLLEMSAHVLQRSGHQLLLSANKLLQEGREPAIVVQELARHFLNLAKASYLNEIDDRDEAASRLIVCTPSYLAGLFEQAPNFEKAELSQLVDLLDKLEQTCRRTSQPAMHLEVGLLALCHRHDMLMVRELAQRVSQLEQGLTPLAGTAQARPQVAQSAMPPVRTQATSTTSGARQQPGYESTQPPPTINSSPADEPIDRLPIDDIDDDVLDLSDTLDEPAETMPNARTTTPPTAITPTSLTAPASLPAVTAKPTAQSIVNTNQTQDDGQASPDEVDRVWSQMLDELQRRHLPTFSLVSMHAFPVSLNAKEFSLGVATEAFQRMIEIKAEHVKNATAIVIGAPINIKIRVTTRNFGGNKPEQKPRERAATTAPTARPTTAAADDEPGEPAGLSPAKPSTTATGINSSLTASERAAARATIAASQEENAPVAPVKPDDNEPYLAPRIDINSPSTAVISTDSAPLTSDTSPTQTPKNGVRETKPVTASQLLSDTASSNTGSIMKEAYKLFEGPGSRRIGD